MAQRQSLGTHFFVCGKISPQKKINRKFRHKVIQNSLYVFKNIFQLCRHTLKTDWNADSNATRGLCLTSTWILHNDTSAGFKCLSITCVVVTTYLFRLHSHFGGWHISIPCINISIHGVTSFTASPRTISKVWKRGDGDRAVDWIQDRHLCEDEQRDTARDLINDF